MLRRTPLKRTGQLKRTHMKVTRPKPSVPSSVRALLVARSGGRCEARLPGCSGQATDAAHRISRKMGGRPDSWHSVAAVLHLCRACHSWCHARPKEAKDLGLMLDEWQDPTREPVAYQNAGWVVLDNEGGLWPVGDAA